MVTCGWMRRRIAEGKASSSEAEKQRVHDDELWAESWDASSQQKVQTAEKVKGLAEQDLELHSL